MLNLINRFESFCSQNGYFNVWREIELSTSEPTRESIFAYRRAHSFLTLMERMDAPSQTAFRKIYDWAPKHKSIPAPMVTSEDLAKSEPLYKTVGRHVRLAMVESVTNPGFAYWVRMNLALRVGRKFAQTTGRLQKAAAIEAVLEAFHVAADAFVLEISLEEATVRREAVAQENARRREKRTARSADTLPTDEVENTPAAALEASQLRQQLVAIGEFKRRVIPGLVHSIRKSVS